MRFLLLLFLFNAQNIFGQVADDSIAMTIDLFPVRFDKNFDLHYRQKLHQMRRAYPLAIRAKEILDTLDADLNNLSSKHKQKKLTKERKAELKEEFTYLLKDLYVSEGVMLMKLIHRETGMTVNEILEKYNGKLAASMVSATFKVFDQDTKSTFNPYDESDDWVTELVIKDIVSGKVDFDMGINSMTKDDLKASMKEYRSDVKAYRKSTKINKKKKKQAEKKKPQPN